MVSKQKEMITTKEYNKALDVVDRYHDEQAQFPKESDIKRGQHFWALLGGKLLVAMKSSNSHDYYVAGDWEGSIDYQYFTVVEFIEEPSMNGDVKKYY